LEIILKELNSRKIINKSKLRQLELLELIQPLEQRSDKDNFISAFNDRYNIFISSSDQKISKDFNDVDDEVFNELINK
jgi:hypothetical protein